MENSYFESKEWNSLFCTVKANGQSAVCSSQLSILNIFEIDMFKILMCTNSSLKFNYLNSSLNLLSAFVSRHVLSLLHPSPASLHVLGGLCPSPGVGGGGAWEPWEGRGCHWELSISDAPSNSSNSPTAVGFVESSQQLLLGHVD